MTGLHEGRPCDARVGRPGWRPAERCYARRYRGGHRTPPWLGRGQAKYSRQEENNRGRSRRKAGSAIQPGTKAGTLSAADDLAELARVLASLTPEERSALLALAKGLRPPAS